MSSLKAEIHPVPHDLFICVRFLQYASELRFDGFSLRSLGSSLSQTAYTTIDNKFQSEVSPELLTIPLCRFLGI